MKKIKLIPIIVLMICWAIQGLAQTKATPEWCDNQWKVDSAGYSGVDAAVKFDDLLKLWLQRKSQCAGTVVYEARLASIYISLNNLSKAREVLQPFTNKPSNYSYLVDFLLIRADQVEVDTNGKLNKSALELFERKLLDYVKKYPNHPEGLAMLGANQMALNQYDLAIKSLEKSLSINTSTKMNASGVYRNLTIGYAAVGRYQDAIESADKAWQLNNGLTSDPFFAYALAKSDAALGDFKSAKDVLYVISKKIPEVQNTNEFKEASQFITDKVNKKMSK